MTAAPQVRAADPGEEIRAVAARLPASLRMGATGFTTPQWDGWVWDRARPTSVLAREGIGSYARHPLLRTVLLDRSSRLKLDTPNLTRLADAVSDDFRFVLAADPALFWGRMPGPAERGGRSPNNPAFFDVELMAKRCVEPFVEGLAARGGVILIRIPSQDPRALGTRKAFPERLARFLCALPAGPRYAVELRDHKLLTPQYAAALVEGGALHCCSIHPSMPDLASQRALACPPSQLAIVRWSMCEHFDYRAAARNYAPYDSLVERDPRAREALLAVLRQPQPSGAQTYVLIDNMAEGCAPATINELATALAQTRA